MALTKISTGGVKDDTADEAKLKVSNAGSNGQFLQKQSGNTGGLTWSDANQYTHPNHSGEVTSTADGAQVIADDVVDEANLKVSNAPTNGYFLSAQSGNTGGLTWAEVSAAPTIQATADGALAANDPAIINSDGTVSKAATIAALTGAKAELDTNEPAAFDVVYDKTNNKIVACWVISAGGYVYATAGTVNAANNTITWGNKLTVYNSDSVIQIAAAATQNSNGEVVICWHRSTGGQVRAMSVRTSSSDNNLTLYDNGGTGELCIDRTIDTTNSYGNYRNLDLAWDTDKQTGMVIQCSLSSGKIFATGLCISGTTITSGVESQFTKSDGTQGGWTSVVVTWDEHNKKFFIAASRHADDDIFGATCNAHTTTGNDDLQNLTNLLPIAESIGDGYVRDIDYSLAEKRVMLHSLVNVSGWKHRLYLIDVASTLGTSMVKASVDVSDDWNSGVGCTTYNPNLKKWLVQVKESNNLKYSLVTNAEDSLTASTLLANFSSTNNGSALQVAYDPDTTRMVLVFRDIADGDDATGVVIRPIDSTLKEGNFIGFANAAYSDSATATINVVGNTTTKSSLTPGKKYYVQTDGTLSTTAGSPSVLAGIALSSTKLLIK